MKHFIPPIAITLLTAAALLAAENIGEPLIAKGKDVAVTQSLLDDAFIAYKASLASRGQTIPETQREEVEKRLLDKIIVTQIMMKRATSADKEKGKAAAEKIISESEKRFSSPAIFKQQLLAAGLTFEDFRSKLLEQATCEQVLERELKATIQIPDSEVKKFYDENPTRFDRAESVKVSHILFRIEDQSSRQPIPADEKKKQFEKAKKVRERAAKGEDFTALVKEFSEDEPSKERNGEYTFARGQMVKAFESTAFLLKTNEVSDVIETPFGYHIIKLHEKLPAAKLEFSKVSSEIREALAQRELQKQMGAYFEKLKKEAGVELSSK